MRFVSAWGGLLTSFLLADTGDGASADKSVTAVHHPGLAKMMLDGKTRQLDLTKQ